MKKLDAKLIINGTISLQEKAVIISILKRLGESKMTESSHSFLPGTEETIWEAAVRGTKSFGSFAKISSAISIMDVILAANRNYEKVVGPHVKRMRKEYPGLTLRGLSKMTLDAHDASSFKSIWGHNDSRKFEILKSVLSVFLLEIDCIDTVENDYNVVSGWAKSANLQEKAIDKIGSIKGIGVATFQHLRMVFGVDTVKPDLRVRQVLEREFGLKASAATSVRLVEEFARISELSPLFIDQIMVKYGSGYYYNKSIGLIKNCS